MVETAVARESLVRRWTPHWSLWSITTIITFVRSTPHVSSTSGSLRRLRVPPVNSEQTFRALFCKHLHFLSSATLLSKDSSGHSQDWAPFWILRTVAPPTNKSISQLKRCWLVVSLWTAAVLPSLTTSLEETGWKRCRWKHLAHLRLTMQIFQFFFFFWFSSVLL